MKLLVFIFAALIGIVTAAPAFSNLAIRAEPCKPECAKLQAALDECKSHYLTCKGGPLETEIQNKLNNCCGWTPPPAARAEDVVVDTPVKKDTAAAAPIETREEPCKPACQYLAHAVEECKHMLQCQGTYHQLEIEQHYKDCCAYNPPTIARFEPLAVESSAEKNAAATIETREEPCKPACQYLAHAVEECKHMLQYIGPYHQDLIEQHYKECCAKNAPTIARAEPAIEAVVKKGAAAATVQVRDGACKPACEYLHFALDECMHMLQCRGGYHQVELENKYNSCCAYNAPEAARAEPAVVDAALVDEDAAATLVQVRDRKCQLTCRTMRRLLEECKRMPRCNDPYHLGVLEKQLKDCCPSSTEEDTAPATVDAPVSDRDIDVAGPEPFAAILETRGTPCKPKCANLQRALDTCLDNYLTCKGGPLETELREKLDNCCAGPAKKDVEIRADTVPCHPECQAEQHAWDRCLCCTPQCGIATWEGKQMSDALTACCRKYGGGRI